MSHSRHNDALRRTRRICVAIAALLAGSSAGIAFAQGLTYVDADEIGFSGPANLTPLTAIDSNAFVNNDSKWGFRPLGAGLTVYESSGIEDAPELTQKITGLTPGTSYDVYVAYWTDADENWTIRAGLAPGVNTLYNHSGKFGYLQPNANATPGISAAAVGAWANLPPVTSTGARFTDGPLPTGDPPTGGDVFDRVLLLGKAGTMAANGAGEINVYIDDNGVGTNGQHRSWLDGVAYMPTTAAPIALSATLSATTGALTLTNPTTTNFQIKSYSITSVTGSLNATTWTPIAGSRDGAGNGSFDSDLWQVTAPATPATTPWTTQLAEGENPLGNGGLLAASGGVINFGNVYAKNRFQDVQLNLTLADNTVVTIVPQYSGAVIDPSDFDANGSLTAADYQILMASMHTDISTFTLGQANRAGDVNADRRVNFSDFAAFRAAYDIANGAGSFAQMVAQVPEPAAASMLLAAGLLLVKQVRGRRRSGLLAMAVCTALASGAQAQPLLSVDFDDRETVRDGVDTGNTVAGFEQFILSGTTATGASPAVATPTMRTLAGYDVTVTPVNAAGVTTSGVDDRDRTTPTTTPTLNQLYDDFVFTATGVGATGGLDVTIQGGSLQANKPYLFSIYAFDSGSTGVTRTADWLDGNRSDVRSLSTSFAGATAPTTDNQYRFTGIALTDATGRLFVRGRNTTPLTGTTINPGVFMNGLQIEEFTGLTLEVNSTTGAIRMLNEQTSSIDLSYYEIRSATGALNATGWASLDDGEGGDAIGVGWDEAVASNANVLSEGNLTSQLSLAASGGSASLGLGYALGGAKDLTFSYAGPGETTLKSGFVKFVTGGGSSNADYDDDSDVDGADFLLWQRQFGTAVPPGTGADGSGNGQVDAADLTLWKTQYGTTPPAVAAAAAVPEPVGCSLAAVALGGMALAARRRR